MFVPLCEVMKLKVKHWCINGWLSKVITSIVKITKMFSPSVFVLCIYLASGTPPTIMFHAVENRLNFVCRDPGSGQLLVSATFVIYDPVTNGQPTFRSSEPSPDGMYVFDVLPTTEGLFRCWNSTNMSEFKAVAGKRRWVTRRGRVTVTSCWGLLNFGVKHSPRTVHFSYTLSSLLWDWRLWLTHSEVARPESRVCQANFPQHKLSLAVIPQLRLGITANSLVKWAHTPHFWVVYPIHILPL